MSRVMANLIDTFSTENKFLCILWGLHGPYVSGWDDIYSNIALFVHQMYLTRCQLYNSTLTDNKMSFSEAVYLIDALYIL